MTTNFGMSSLPVVRFCSIKVVNCKDLVLGVRVRVTQIKLTRQWTLQPTTILFHQSWHQNDHKERQVLGLVVRNSKSSSSVHILPSHLPHAFQTPETKKQIQQKTTSETSIVLVAPMITKHLLFTPFLAVLLVLLRMDPKCILTAGVLPSLLSFACCNGWSECREAS